MPRVSVVVPTYNRADVLSRAIDSVLDQTVTDLELLVVDDGSSDHTPGLVRQYDDPRLTYIRHGDNRGGSVARNTGITAASGDYVAFLDSDDAWRPRKLEAQLETVADRGPDWIGAYCDIDFVSDGRLMELVGTARRLYRKAGLKGVQTEGGEDLIKHILGDELHTSAGSTLLLERDVVEAMDGFDESFDRFQDSEFLIRALQRGKIAHVTEPLVERYDSADPSADAVREADEHYLETFEETVDRLEADGHAIRSVHELMLARLYFAEGRFLDGLGHLVDAKRPRPTKLPGLVYSVVRGFHSRVPSAG